MRVRAAVPDDAGGIAAVHIRAWQAAYRGVVPDAVLDGLDVEARAERWRDILSGEASETLVAEIGGAVAGFASAIVPSRDADAEAGTGEVAALYVDPGHWRAGVGTALLEAVLDALRAAGCDRAALWAIAGSAATRGFYPAHGFTPDGARRREPVGSLRAAESPEHVRLVRAL